MTTYSNKALFKLLRLLLSFALSFCVLGGALASMFDRSVFQAVWLAGGAGFTLVLVAGCFVEPMKREPYLAGLIMTVVTLFVTFVILWLV